MDTVNLPVVPVVVGPTASGKTAVALALARIRNGEIISADSRQVYKLMDIGTAKPTPAERSEIRHHFIDTLLPDQDFNAGMFGEMGRATIDEILGRGRLPIVVGGSGLYIHSLIDGLFDGPGADREYRLQLEARVHAGGLPELVNELRRVDPVGADRIDPTKPRRVIRALEVFHLTGIPLSQHHKLSRIEIRFTPMLVGLAWERSTLYARIEKRCDNMIEQGFLHEVDTLLKNEYDLRCNALNTVGYAEAIRYRNGELTREEMIKLFKQNSRRYAKRQMTWFRRDTRIKWLNAQEQSAESLAACIAKLVPAQNMK